MFSSTLSTKEFPRTLLTRRRLTAAACVAAAGLARSASADYFWLGGNTDYNTTNWVHYDYTQTPNVVTSPVGPPQGVGNDFNTLNGTSYGDPTSGQTVLLPGGTVNITAGDPAWQVNDLRAGSFNGTSGTYVQTGSTVSVNGGFLMGDAAGGSGTYNLSGGLIQVTGFNSGNGGINQRTNIGSVGGVGVLNVTGGTFNQGNSHFSLGDNDASVAGGYGSVGTVNLSNATINALQNEFWVGNRGTGDNSNPANYDTGYLNVSSGGTLSVGSWLVAGRFGAHGYVSVTGNAVVNKTTAAGGNTQWGVGDGAIAVVNTTDQSTMNLATEVDMSVGGGTTAATSTWNVSGQAVVNIGGLFQMTDNAKNNATVNLSGTATINVGSGEMWVGERGTGTTTITGGTLQLNNWLAIGRDGGSGTVNLANGTIVKNNNSNGNITLAGGNSLLNQTSGSIVATTSDLWVGEGDPNSHVWLMSGGSAALGQLSVGRSTVGTFNMSGGTLTTGNASVAYGNGAQTGIWNITGNAAATAATVFVGRLSGTGTLNISGGSLTAAQVVRGGSTNGAQTVSLNTGGTLRAAVDTANFVGGFNSGEFLVNGGTIDTNGHAVAINSPLGGSGGFIKTGAGTLTIASSAASSYTGQTVVSAGTLQLAAPTRTIPASVVSAYYSFEDNSNGNTSLFHDSSGNGNDLIQPTDNNNNPVGTIAASTNAPAGHAGSISLTNGAYLSTPSFTAPSNFPLGNSAYTFAAWINIDGATSSSNGIIGYGNYGTNNTVNAFRTDTNTSGVNNYWWGNDLNAGTNSLVGNWHYVAVTYDPSYGASGQRTLWLDGTAISTNDPGSAHNATAANFGIGATNSYQEIFSGNMADLIVATTAFTPGQLTAAMNNAVTTSMTSTGQISAATTVNIASGATFDLNGGNQTVAGLIGVGGSSVTLGAGTLTVNATTTSTYLGSITGSGGLTVSGTAPFTVSTIGYSGSTTVNGQLVLSAATGPGKNAVSFAGPVVLNAGGSLTLANSSSAATRTVAVFTGGLSIAAGATTATAGSLDVGNNDAIVRGGSIGSLSAAAGAGFNGGSLNGQGIRSSAAASDTRHVMAVGVILNSGAGGATVLGTFDGVAVNNTDVLVKYTYFGDANLDGKVDGSDYSRIDNGYLTAGSTGWYNGDFNYDGKVDASDYTLIDNGYNRQGVQLTSAALVASPSALVAAGPTSAVPEPTALALLTATPLLARRRRR